MRWYLLILLASVFTVALVRADSDSVPSLEYEQEYVDDMDELLAQTTAPKIPRWKIILQQWGATLVAYLLRFKEYSVQQYEKAKIHLYALLYTKNNVAVDKS